MGGSRCMNIVIYSPECVRESQIDNYQKPALLAGTKRQRSERRRLVTTPWESGTRQSPFQIDSPATAMFNLEIVFILRRIGWVINNRFFGKQPS